MILPFEIVVAAECIRYWDDSTSQAVWYTMFLLAIIIVNIFGVLGYGEEEFWTSLLKLATIVIFMIAALVLVLGGGPSDGQFGSYWGARYVRVSLFLFLADSEQNLVRPWSIQKRI